MHSARELRSSAFRIAVDGRPGTVADLFPGFREQDRLGLVMSRPCGALGASALISATVTAFYDIQRARGPDFFIYPDYFLFHVGRPLGDHGQLDVWPSRKEVVVSADPEGILEAIDDRAITRLVVEDGPPAEPAFSKEALASAGARIETCLAYSPSGRVADADVRIASNRLTEGYVEAILAPEARIERLRSSGNGAATERIAEIEARIGEVAPEIRERIRIDRPGLVEDGVPVESYRRTGLDDALALLASAGAG